MCPRTPPQRHIRRLLPHALLVLLGALPALGQGTGPYVNFETPVHDGLLVSKIGSGEYLLVASSEDNAVEVYDTAGPTFLLRVPVGLEPVTVVRKPTALAGGGVRFYTANWLGDSITAFVLEPSGGTPPLGWRIERTVATADEPIGITILPEVAGVATTLPGSVFHEAVIVTHAARGAYAVLDSATLLPFGAGWGALELFDTTGGLGIKEPRALEFAPPTAGVSPQMAVLNLRGGNTGSVYDFDLWVTTDLAQSIVSGRAVGPTVGNLGTTNFNMDFDSRSVLYVVGQEARNAEIGKVDINGEQQHHDMETLGTGFVRSALWRVQNFAGTPTIRELDLNRGLAGSSGVPTCAIPTDLEIHENAPPTAVLIEDAEPVAVENAPQKLEVQPVPTTRTRIFVACMGSDTVSVVIPNASNFPASRVIRVDTNAGGFSAANLGGQMRGPRALAFKDSTPRRLYVLNRVEHSVTVMNPDFNLASPASAVLATFDLAGQVAPPRVRNGRKIFYTSKLSGGGKSACASCHIDGDSDQLSWNLSGPGLIDATTVLPGALLPILPGGQLGTMTNHKGPMVTQTLRGLLNYEIFDNLVADLLYSNQPYHWRGDKGFFTDFNAAFLNLMGFCAAGVTCVDPGGNGAKNKGIPDSDMAAFRDFINTITQEPNPEQPKTRTYSGSPWSDPDNPPPAGSQQELLELNNVTVGSGAIRGLKIFHMITQAENCLQCHALPEGSDNDLTETLGNQVLTLPPSQLETAATRDLVRKEKFLFRRSGNPASPLIATGVRTAEFGLVHTGEDHILPFGSGSIFAFVTGFETGGTFNPPETVDVSLYLREFDSGVAPAIGLSFTVEQPFYSNPANQPVVDAIIDLLEGQANAANIGVAAHLQVAGTTRGFWFDVTENGSFNYQEEPYSGVPSVIGPLSRTLLMSFVGAGGAAGNHVTFFATPLGSDRRVAFLDGGIPGPLPGTLTASNLQLDPLIPNTANRWIPQFQVAWPTLGSVNQQILKQTRLLQRALWQFADNPATYDVGLDFLRHEAPRRFRVRGDDIKPGAWIALTTPAPDPLAPGQPSCNPFDPQSVIIAMPIFPARDDNGDLVWETAGEIDSRMMYALMAGWIFSPGVVGVLTNPAQYDETNPPNPSFPVNPQLFYLPGTFDPATWSQYVVQVANDLGSGQQTIANGGCQRLTLN